MARPFRTPALVALAAVAAGLTAAAPAPRDAGPNTLTVGLWCITSAASRLECHAEPSGGTAPYSFSWRPTPVVTMAGDDVLIACSYGQYRTVSVVVTDANGATASASGSFYCGNPV